MTPCCIPEEFLKSRSFQYSFVVTILPNFATVAFRRLSRANKVWKYWSNLDKDQSEAKPDPLGQELTPFPIDNNKEEKMILEKSSSPDIEAGCG